MPDNQTVTKALEFFRELEQEFERLSISFDDYSIKTLRLNLEWFKKRITNWYIPEIVSANNKETTENQLLKEMLRDYIEFNNNPDHKRKYTLEQLQEIVTNAKAENV